VTLSARTRVAGVIGSPVRHSLSPAIHNAAFAAAGLDWAFLAFEVEQGSAAAALEGARALGLGGLSVTMPHKADVAAAVDERSAVVDRLGAANCVIPVGQGRLRGESTDGAGFVRSLADAGVDPAGMRCCVLGAGGAARAVVLALAGAGAAAVTVVNRTEANGARAAELAGAAGRVAAGDAVTAALGDADLVVNATSVGMGGGPPPIDVRLLGVGQVVADLVYEPIRTALLDAAAVAGCRTVDGLGMLLHQAALAFESWTGETAPLDAMRGAIAAHLRDPDISVSS
jgi:shikimate dehydrogenase